MLSKEQKKEIREEIVFTLSTIEQEKQNTNQKNNIEKVISYLSNGFVLLIIGTVITSILVPIYQNRQHTAAHNLSLKKETFSQFLLYTNSIWKEYYLMFPLVHESKIDKEKYNHYLNQISKVKLERYNAYSKIRGVAISFRDYESTKISDVEKQIKKYAIELNRTSEMIDEWLRYLYCREINCVNAVVPESFTSYGTFLELANKMQFIYNKGNDVSENLVFHMKNR